MPKGTPANLVGRRFGRLTVIQKTPLRYKGGGVIWECECECGIRPVYVSTANLTHGRQSSCGCYARERKSEVHTTHGMTGTRLYQRFRNIVQKFPVCQRWKGRNGFQSFLADMGEPPAKADLLRRDPEKPFSKRNCYWGSRGEVVKRARGVLLSYKNEARYITEWAEILGVSRQCVQQGGERYLHRRLSEIEQS